MASVKPTVAILSYGMTAALEGGEVGVPAHVADLGKLMDAVEEVSGGAVRFVLLGPSRQALRPPFTKELLEKRASNLRALHAVQEGTRRLAKERGAAFVGFDVPEAVQPDDLYSGPEPSADGVTPNRRTLKTAAWVIVNSLGIEAGPEGEREVRWPGRWRQPSSRPSSREI